MLLSLSAGPRPAATPPLRVPLAPEPQPAWSATRRLGTMRRHARRTSPLCRHAGWKGRVRACCCRRRSRRRRLHLTSLLAEHGALYLGVAAGGRGASGHGANNPPSFCVCLPCAAQPRSGPEPQVHRGERCARQRAVLLRAAQHRADQRERARRVPAGGVAGWVPFKMPLFEEFLSEKWLV